MNPNATYTFREITESDIPAVQSFIIRHLNLYFQANRPTPRPDEDILDLRSHYLHHPRNLLLGAWDAHQQLIATLAVCQYDDRIMALRGRYDLANTAEICRCYVEQEHRRRGIGRQLMTLAEAYCQHQQYKTLYLHTHHFLPGGYQFWCNNHFNVFLDEGGEQQIVHMEKHIEKCDVAQII
ncbi:GNAT family N-acetyltransferase [Citrobacter freundii]|uniref:GNAT family N-acetyltransferase n=1 Tax=Citrobacter sp. wls718 TaxID=2576418 RepID=UPI000DFD6EFB|nr:MULTISPECIES: GNAT family N-acetyltransferase [Citrobacter]QLO42469.1 GNAT family N-acetyltransferase [Citrobacter freundii]QLV40634.1 GNAT family N-acetyltransferase [Citrobacter freundii]TKU27893.1 GNAT family N-acetyltransferase [Citrobacter sp. wls718]STE16625.1 Acetyltransferase (GNAT) family [Escherichia coli]